jgi:hypothetical protein
MGVKAKTAGLMALLVAAQQAQAQTTLYLAPPPAGSTADVTGTVTGVPAGNYKVRSTHDFVACVLGT